MPGHAPVIIPHGGAVTNRYQKVSGNLPADEADLWLRTLLSVPAHFQRLDTDDALYAEVISLRNDIANFARAVVPTARQTIRLIYDFKLRKQRELQVGHFGADQIAAFYADHTRHQRGDDPRVQKRTVDTCITIKERLLDVADADRMVALADERGDQSCWNAVYKLQEVIYRCQTPAKIAWVMCGIQDAIASGRIVEGDVTVGNLKTGKSSITDPLLTQFELKRYLLGRWLDGKDLF